MHKVKLYVAVFLSKMSSSTIFFWAVNQERIYMETHKLKLDKFKHVGVFNFPDTIDLEIETASENYDVLIYYIEKLEDVDAFVKLVVLSKLPRSNRTIMVYKKGRKDGVNRDSIFMPFRGKKYINFKLRAPMLCSISKELSACVMSFES